MIKLNFVNDGVYIIGHDTKEICNVISYAMWACINDCRRENKNIKFYESCNDENWNHLGFTYLQIDSECQEHKNS